MRVILLFLAVVDVTTGAIDQDVVESSALISVTTLQPLSSTFRSEFSTYSHLDQNIQDELARNLSANGESEFPQTRGESRTANKLKQSRRTTIRPNVALRATTIGKRQILNRGRLDGCGNERLREIMQRVLGPLLTRIQHKIGDIAQKLQKVAQLATGKSFEVFLAKGDIVLTSHQMRNDSHCRSRVGSMLSMIYETPVQYDVNDEASEKFLSNIDFGEPLGGSGFPGQEAFPKFEQLRNLVNHTDIGMRLSSRLHHNGEGAEGGQGEGHHGHLHGRLGSFLG